jgi:DNA-binding ferritin-like protein
MILLSASSKKTSESIAPVLATLFTREMILYIKTKYFHWIACKAQSMNIRNLFELQTMQLEMTIGKVAARINVLGAKTIGLTHTHGDMPMTQIPGNCITSKGMLVSLLKDHESLLLLLRKQVPMCIKKKHDVLTSGLLTGTMIGHESAVWALRKQLVQNSGIELEKWRKQSNE